MTRITILTQPKNYKTEKFSKLRKTANFCLLRNYEFQWPI